MSVWSSAYPMASMEIELKMMALDMGYRLSRGNGRSHLALDNRCLPVLQAYLEGYYTAEQKEWIAEIIRKINAIGEYWLFWHDMDMYYISQHREAIP